MSILTYFLIGSLFTLGLDILAQKLETQSRFNTFERVFVIMLWPIMMVMFIYEFIKNINNR